MTASSQQPRHLRSLYSPTSDGGIIVYAGDLQLSRGGLTWLAPGDIELRLSPRSALVARFAGQDEWLNEDRYGERATVSLPPSAKLQPPTMSAVPTQPPSFSQWTMLDIPLDRLDGGDISRAERFLLHVSGKVTRYPLPNEQTDEGEQGQLPFALPGWNLRLAAVESESGQGDAHFSVVIEAEPLAAPADDKGIDWLTRQMFNLLSFVTSKETAVAAAVGLDGSGQVAWAKWGPPRVSHTPPQWHWCPERLIPAALPILAAGLTALAIDLSLEACVDRAINLFLVANSGGVLDVRVPMACSGLEVLGWSVLQHHQWLTTDGLSKLSAGARTRLLMKWAGVPIDLPAAFHALPTRLRAFGPPDSAGPELIFEIRNRVVHPPKKLTDLEWPGSDELFETWQLATWYLELAILRAFGYGGEYVNRLQLTGWSEQSEPVPWR